MNSDAQASSSAASQKRFFLWGSAIILVGIVALGIAWKQFLAFAEEQRSKLPAVTKDGRFDDYGRLADFSFRNWDGREVSRASLAGKVWVVDFVFTTCSGLCPVMSQSMQRLQTRIQQSAGIDMAKLRLVTVTTDPDIDTPTRLEAYSKRFSADPDLWYFVRGPFADVQRFSQEALKLGLERATQQQIAKGSEKVIHSNKFVLIDARGHARKIYTGTTPSDIDALVRDLPALLAESAGQGTGDSK